MSATTHQLLPHDAGLPRAVRLALNDFGAACNHAAVAVTHAFAFQMQYTNDRETRIAPEPEEQTTGPEKMSAAARVVMDLELIADSFHAQTVVALARAAALYAVYASQVATAVLAGRTAPLPDPAPVKPSDLIAALDLYLPQIQFPAHNDPRMTDCNADVLSAHTALRNVISGQLWGENALAYDDPAVVRAGGDEPWGTSATFADALHSYGAALTWALGTFTRIHEAGDPASPDVVA
ncbi:hypothetical protein [Actinoplanes aureus]|uniref:Uncharacterized protein n=1 Tax=Actinoplanes aureus TaxID=2792083 RepID=A0A931CCT7_9ACTN|nr:hypothetical protein [Actinoplanes aureus]MBG0567545.1 hypothetical protein [Actinoplanes aureus]